MTVTTRVAGDGATATGEPTGRRLTRRRGARTPARSITDVTRDALFGVVGIIGILAVAWLVFSAMTGATIVTFMTGSMSPQIPQGGASISLPADAADLRVGDIVTVRPDGSELPVTHRIVSISETTDPSTRELVLKGDANDTPDPRPYIVADAPRVLIGGPSWGTILVAARSPIAIAAMTLLVAGLCLSAFWPSRRSEES